MALLKCPECGGSVSSTVNKCIHCGYEFSVCPSCQTIVDRNAKFCPECGSPVESVQNQIDPVINQGPIYEPQAEHRYIEEDEKPEFPLLEDLVKNIRKPAGYYIFRTFNIMAFVMGMIFIVIFILGAIVGLIQVSLMTEITVTLECLIFMFLSSILFGISDFWSSIEKFFLISGIKKWSKQLNVNLVDVIKSGEREYNESYKHDKNMAAFAYAYRDETTSQSPVKPLILAIFKIIQAVMSTIMFLPLIYINASVISTSPLDFSNYVGIPFIIVAILISVVLSIIINILQGNIKKGMERHIDNIMSKK